MNSAAARVYDEITKTTALRILAHHGFTPLDLSSAFGNKDCYSRAKIMAWIGY